MCPIYFLLTFMFLYIRVIEFLFVIVFPCNSCLVCFSSVLNICLIVIFKYHGLRQILSYPISVYIMNLRGSGGHVRSWGRIREGYKWYKFMHEVLKKVKLEQI